MKSVLKATSLLSALLVLAAVTAGGLLFLGKGQAPRPPEPEPVAVAPAAVPAPAAPAPAVQPPAVEAPADPARAGEDSPAAMALRHSYFSTTKSAGPFADGETVLGTLG